MSAGFAGEDGLVAFRLVPALAAMAVLATDGLAQPPKIGKPVPVPSTKMPTLPPAVIDDTLAIGGEDIKARKVETRMTVEVALNGRSPYQFVVDSGADTSAVGVRIAQQLRMPLATRTVLHSMTESAEVDRVWVEQLKIGNSAFGRLALPALKEEDLGGDGMLGIDALVQQRLMMDFEKRTIKVEDARIPVVKYEGEIVINAKRRRGQLILTEVRAANLPVDAVIDTGSEITIGNLALRDKLLRNNRDKFVTIAVTGVTGKTMKLQLAKIGTLRLGSVTMRNVPMAFADVPPFTVFDLQRQPSLLLGTDVLEVFRKVSLDFRNRKVRFQLRRCGSTHVALSTSTGTATRLSSGENYEVCRR